MKGDFTRSLRKSPNDDRLYLRQQGRVDLDSDWNDYVVLRDLLERDQTLDVIGPAGAPKTHAGFAVSDWTAGNFQISAGKFWVDGYACEAPSGTTYQAQPFYLPAALPAVPSGKKLLVALDVWERNLTAAEDDSILEEALRGVDTTTRVRRIWQVKAVLVDAALTKSTLPSLAMLLRPGSGTLTASYQPVSSTLDPCQLISGEEYSGLDNRLYRVEVHFPGELLSTPRGNAAIDAQRIASRRATVAFDAFADSWQPGQPVELFDAGAPAQLGTSARVTAAQVGGAKVTLDFDQDVPTAATLKLRRIAAIKWSRDNAAVAYAAESPAAGHTLRMRQLGRDSALALGQNDIVELLDEERALWGLPGWMLTITSAVDPVERSFSVDRALDDFRNYSPAPAQLSSRVWVRRWNQGADVIVPSDAPIPLELGLQLTLRGDGVSPPYFRAGDYWTFHARSVSHSIEALTNAAPNGVQHHLAALALVAADGSVEDCRSRFPALTDIAASDVSFQPQACAEADSAMASARTVQEALDALCRLNLGAEVRLHNRLLHGHGVVCGLKLKCNHQVRGSVAIGKGYALDCEGYGIHLDQELEFDALTPAAQYLDPTQTGTVALSIARNAAGMPTIAVEGFTAQSLLDRALEGTLIKDFYVDYIESLLKWLKSQLAPFPATTVPVPTTHRRTLTLLQLLWQLINPVTGRNVFVSMAEHELLKTFYDELRARLESETFCAMYDGATPFPTYPFPEPVGETTIFGLLGLHRRVRVFSEKGLAYSFGGGSSDLHVYDLSKGEMVAKLAFPSGSNVQIQDVAFHAQDPNDPLSRDRVHVVATFPDVANKIDSVFATATIEADGTHAWGPTTVVCAMRFVTLCTSSQHPQNVYAIAKSLGLFVFDPASIPPVPSANVSFNATGLFVVSADGARAYAAESEATPVGTETSDYTRVRSIDLTNLTNQAPAHTYTVGGTDERNGMTHTQDRLWISGKQSATSNTSLFCFDTAATPPSPPPVHITDLGIDTYTRITAPAQRSHVVVSLADTYTLLAVDAAGAIVAGYRIPVQIAPLDVTSDAAGAHAYALNALGTLSAVDLSIVLDLQNPPSYTVEPGSATFPDVLGDYRADAIKAFFDLLKRFGQYLKDGFCSEFLVKCPECSPDDKVYLGTVEFKNGQTFNICNFDKRHYVKSFRTYGYWLSTFPVLNLFKEAFKQFCCLIVP